MDPENCNVTHVRKGKQVEDAAKSKRDETALVDNLKIGGQIQVPGCERVCDDEKLALTLAAKPYLQRLSIIWTSRLSDANRLKATNQFALPVLTYPMWTQQWPLGELQSTDRETRKLIVRMVGDTLLALLPCWIF